MTEKAKSKKTTKTKTTAKSSNLHPLAYEIIGISLIAFAIIEFFEFGIIGRLLHSISMFFFGNLHFVVPLIAIIISGMLMVKRHGVAFKPRIIYGVLFIVAALSIFSHSLLIEELTKSRELLSDSVLKETWRILISTDGIANRSNALGGGFIGAFLFSMLHILLDSSGAKVVAVVFLIVGIILITGKALVPFLMEKAPELKRIIGKKKRASQPKKRRTTKKANDNESPVEEHELEPVVIDIQTITEYQDTTPVIQHFTQNVTKIPEQAKVEEVDDGVVVDDIQLDRQEVAENTTYVLPSLNLLNEPPESDQSGEYKAIKSSR